MLHATLCGGQRWLASSSSSWTSSSSSTGVTASSSSGSPERGAYLRIFASSPNKRICARLKVTAAAAAAAPAAIGPPRRGFAGRLFRRTIVALARHPRLEERRRGHRSFDTLAAVSSLKQPAFPEGKMDGARRFSPCATFLGVLVGLTGWSGRAKVQVGDVYADILFS